MPDSFVAYRKQRYRWAYGAMMIMKRHWRELLPFTGSKLHPAQRYQFLAGGCPGSRRAAALLHPAGFGLDRRHDPGAEHDAAAADALSDRHPRHVLLQGPASRSGSMRRRCPAVSSTISAPRSPALRSPIRSPRRSGAASSPTTCRSTARRAGERTGAGARFPGCLGRDCDRGNPDRQRRLGRDDPRRWEPAAMLWRSCCSVQSLPFVSR